jgi:AcrR family transcriptional regulator
MKSGQLNILLEKSSALFKKFGVKALTLDAVAKQLGMSKKTIYQLVTNKSELVKLSMKFYLQHEQEQLESIIRPSKNSVEELIEIVSYFYNQVHEFNVATLIDLQKYYPETWEMYTEYRYHYMLGKIVANLENGVKQGVYRKDLDADIVARIYIGSMELLSNQDLFPSQKYAFVNTYREYLNYHLRGIASCKGLKLIEQHNLFKS